MSLLQSIILGVIQGIGEFLPISSSAHLIIIPYLFDFSLNMTNEAKMAFDVALHFGTLISVIIIYYKEWLSLFKGAYKKIVHKKNSFENKMFWYIVLATIPGALIGKLLEDTVENFFRQEMLIIALILAIVGLLIYVGDKWASKHYKYKETSFEKLTLKQTFIVGCSQALAIIPGFSRSGTTILTGRLLGISREAITKFTFLLSTPIIFGATILNLPNLAINTEVIMGIITSSLIGIISIKFLIKYIKNHDFAIFAYYRVIIALLVIIKLIF
ncbi:MAG: undecaprenyl-diphosphate phosphatase [bacterium]|nr:undecaprenyl-diphosphate phosphatase [bacterium]